MYPGAAGAIVRKEKPKREGKANFGQERKVLLTQLEVSARAQGKNETKLQSLLDQLPNDLPTLTQSWKDLQRDLGMGLTLGTSSSRRHATSSAIKELKKHSPSKGSTRSRTRKSRDSSSSPHRPRTQNLSLDEVLARASQREDDDRRSVDSGGERSGKRADREKLGDRTGSGTGSGSRVSWASSPRHSPVSPGLSLDEGIDEGDETAQDEEDVGEPAEIPTRREEGEDRAEAATWGGSEQEAEQQQVVVIPYAEQERGNDKEDLAVWKGEREEEGTAEAMVESQGAVSAVQLEGWVRELEEWEAELEEKERELGRQRRQLMEKEVGMDGRAQELLEKELALDEAFAELEVREGEILRQLRQLDQARRDQGQAHKLKTTRSYNEKSNGPGNSGSNGRNASHYRRDWPPGHSGVPTRTGYFASDRDFGSEQWHGNLNVIRASHSDLLGLGHQPETQPRSYSHSPSKPKLSTLAATGSGTLPGPGPARQLDFRKPGPRPETASGAGSNLRETKLSYSRAEEEAHVTRRSQGHSLAGSGWHPTVTGARRAESSLSPPVQVRLPDTDMPVSSSAARAAPGPAAADRPGGRGAARDGYGDDQLDSESEAPGQAPLPELEAQLAPSSHWQAAGKEARTGSGGPGAVHWQGNCESRSGGKSAGGEQRGVEGEAPGRGEGGSGSPERSREVGSGSRAKSPRTTLHVEQLRQILLDGDDHRMADLAMQNQTQEARDKLAAFSRYLGHGANNIQKNVLLLCVDIEAFSYLADEEELSLYAHDVFNQYLKETARRDVGDLRTHAALLKQRFAEGDLAPNMYARLQDAALEKLVEPFGKYVASSSSSLSSPSYSPTMRVRC